MTQSNDRFFDVPLELSDLETAAAAILPVPYDRTSTWKKGADRGAAALLEASQQVELYDIETASEPYLRGIATLDPVSCDQSPEILADLVEARVGELFGRGVLPVVVGGDHSVSIGAIRAAARHRPGCSVLQLDAHADTRESYQGSKFNHACVMARARQWCSIVQVGIRSVDTSELEGLDMNRVIWADEIAADANVTGAWIERAIAGLTDEVYVTIDLDCFDPSVMPATGTPEPGGLNWYQVVGLLREVSKRRKIIGFDVVELLPTPGQWASEFLAAKLTYRLLALIFASQSIKLPSQD